MLHAGDVAEYPLDLAGWSFRVWGEVDTPLELDWQAFTALPQTTVVQDIHCVTRWSRFDASFTGVAWATLRELVGPTPVGALRDRARRGRLHRQRPRLAARGSRCAPRDARRRGAALTRARLAGAARSSRASTSGRAPSGSAGIELVAHDRPGFWERYGYHNDADPWKEQRYAF